MPEIRRVCVFCGSRTGARPSYAAAAARLGARLAEDGLDLVSGGGRVGLMGVVANAVLDGGGQATGVIPQALAAREVGHTDLTTLHVVGTMHERKALMAELADAFVALPGGLGTLEELAEVLTWAGLGIHAKPCAILDVDGYYAPLLAWLDAGVEQDFISAHARQSIVVASDPDALVDRLLHLGHPAGTPGEAPRRTPEADGAEADGAEADAPEAGC